MRHHVRLIAFILLFTALTACAQRNAASPEQALLQWPGHLSAANAESLHVLARQELPLGVVLLYEYESARQELAGQRCLTTTFVSGDDDDGWRAQSSGGLGCVPPLTANETEIRVTGGGNITGLTTVYGQAPGAVAVRVQWGDGQTTENVLFDGALLVARDETVGVKQVDLLDTGGNVLHSRSFCEGAC